MKIVAISTENPKSVLEFQISSLDYNQKEGGFEIPAGGYIIISCQRFKPITVEFDKSKFYVIFKSLAEVDDFYSWLKKAESDASNSYSRMLD